MQYNWHATHGDLTSRTQTGYDDDGTSLSRTWTYSRDSMRRVWRLDGPRTDVYDTILYN